MDEALLNGELSPSIALKAGVRNRLRLINITACLGKLEGEVSRGDPGELLNRARSVMR